MESIARKIADASRLQLVFLAATWIAGIYVNGFVPIIPGTAAGVILLDPAVDVHVVLATLSAATSVFILALAWAEGRRRPAALALMASLSIVLAGDSGIAFVLGGGSEAGQSMMMAVAFATAVFFTFFSMASLHPEETRTYGGETANGALDIGYVTLVLFYAVFVSGIYVNLFVVGPVFSLPLGLEAAAFKQAESSAGFLIHEALGALLLVSLVVLTAALWSRGTRRSAGVSAAPALLVAYSAYVGSLNLTSPPVPGTASTGSALVSMLSSAGLIAALVVTMLLLLRLRTDRSHA
ncbi:MAG TPA: hypothetical protein VLY65_00610 [Nitrososphaerales archaeon]|nr:hypothetical protein [Nitrososphaerales archaeon]